MIFTANELPIFFINQGCFYHIPVCFYNATNFVNFAVQSSSSNESGKLPEEPKLWQFTLERVYYLTKCLKNTG